MSKIALASALLAGVLGASPPPNAAEGSLPLPAPHIVLIVADDMGWADIGWEGHDPNYDDDLAISTPALDELADQGVRLDRFYVAPWCTPTRMALMTGRYPIRWGLQGDRGGSERGLPRHERTLPEMLRSAGYGATHAIGKWHMGSHLSKFHPINSGFGSFLGSHSGAVWYYSKISSGQNDWHRDFDPAPIAFPNRPICETPQTFVPGYVDYHTTQVGDEAVAFIDAHYDDEEPFFLYVSFQAAHTPPEAPLEAIEPYTDAGHESEFPDGWYCSPPASGRADFLAQVTVMDENIDKILRRLDSRGITNDTLVWFLSDNGADDFLGAGSSAPLSGSKLSVLDGGIRVPSVVRYPVHFPAGAVSDQLVSHVDVLPTLLDVAGAPLTTSLKGQSPTSGDLDERDGESVYHAIQGSYPVRNGKDHFSYCELSTTGYSLIRHQQGSPRHLWKLVWRGGAFEVGYTLGTPLPPGVTLELFDLESDPLEATALDLAAHSTLVDDLLARMAELVSLRPEETGSPEYPPLPNWAFYDQPTDDGERYIIYKEKGSDTFQKVAILGDTGQFVPIGDTKVTSPDQTEVLLHGIGRNPQDGLLYGITADGTNLYQLDATGFVIHLGVVTNDGLASNANITAGDFHPTDGRYYCFDNKNDQLFRIELGDLVAEELLPTAAPGPINIADFAFDSGADLLAFDTTLKDVWRWTLLGTQYTASRLNQNYTLGSNNANGAAWVDGNDDLLVYKRKSQAGGGMMPDGGVYRLKLSPPWGVQQIIVGPTLFAIDGAGVLP